MGLFDGLLGNASELDTDDVEREMKRLLTDEEVVEKAYKLVRDLIIFTNKRLLLVDKQGMTAKKVEYHSIPYKSITHYSIETAGHFDLEAELKIWIKGSDLPIEKQFNRSLDVYELQRVLASYT